MTAQLQDAPLPLNPFPGLRPFEPDEDYLFFGRERQTDELLRRLRSTRFLSILGTSGSGKSSLVRSGLIPSLHGGGMTMAGSRWRVAIMRPGEDPLGNLAAALDAPDALGGRRNEEGLNRAFFETTVRASRRGIVDCIRETRIPAGDNVLVLVDQFEELFRFKRSRRAGGRDEAVAFVKLLLTARQSEVPCYIAITMRSDFIGDCLEFGDLPEIVNEGIYLVPRMTRDELKLAITGPVAVGGATIAPRLVSRLLNDVGDDPDQLPILQHALMRTWERWECDHQPGEPLDLSHYEATGTMSSALSRHADEAFEELDADGKEIAEMLFRALTDKESDVRGVRRPAALEEVVALTRAPEKEVASVVETFRKPGRSFLMPPASVPLHAESVLDLSHESLMRVWGQLSRWAEEESKSAQLYVGVAEAAERHERRVAGLWRDPELQLALTWRETEKPTEVWAARYDSSFDRAMAFLDASEQERDRKAREKDAARRRELKRTRMAAMILSFGIVITLALGVFAFRQMLTAKNALVAVKEQQAVADAQRRRAEQQADRAEQQKQAAEAAGAVAQKQTLVAEQERVNAEQQRATAEEQARIAQVQTSLAETARVEATVAEKKAKENELVAVAQTQEAVKARTEAQTSETETRRLSHLAAARALALSIVKEAGPQSKLLALEAWSLHRESGGREQDPDIFSAMRTALFADTPAPVRKGALDAVRAVAITPDGRTAIAGADDGGILWFDLAHDGAPASLAKLSSGIRSLAVRASGDLLAAGTTGGAIVAIDLRDVAAPPRELASGSSTITSVAFQPHGSLLAAASFDGAVRLWNIDDAKPAPAVLRAPDGQRVHALAFSSDGTMLAVAQVSGGVARYDVARPADQPRVACSGVQVRSVAFRPKGDLVACGSREGFVILDDGGRTPSRRLVGHASTVNAIQFDPAGNLLASASSDGTVRIWDTTLADPQAVVLPGHTSWVWSLGFTPNGERIISGAQDKTLRIWPARASVLAADLCRAAAGTLTEAQWEKWMPSDVAFRASPCVVR